jgi:hypothetical protein
MPTYTFKNKTTGEEWTEVLSISTKEEFLADNPDIVQMIVSAPALHSGAGLGLRRIDDGFKDVLGKIATGAPGHKMNL